MAALKTLTVLALIGVSNSQTSDCSYYGLLNHLNVTSSNSLLEIMRPVKNWTSTTLVKMDMLLYSILDVDEKIQTVTCHIQVDMYWTNEFLSWKPSEFCGIDMVTLPRSMLWTPDISIREDTSDDGSLQEDPLVSLYPSGLVYTNSRYRLTYTCHLNLFRFPFDVQRCNITFSSLSSEAKYIQLKSARNDTTLTRLSNQIMTTQGEWKLERMDIIDSTLAANGSSSSKLVYVVTLQRKPFLYVINLIMPLLFLLVLDLASFCISEASGEKLGFKVTILLSIFVLLLILKDILPSTEDNLPLMAIYCVVVFTLVWISVLEAMLIRFLTDLDSSHSEDEPNSEEVKVNIRQGTAHHKEGPAGIEEKVKAEKNHFTLEELGDHDLLKLIQDQIKAAQLESERQKEGMKKAGCCRKVAAVIDAVFFVLYLITVVLAQMCMFVLWNLPEF